MIRVHKERMMKFKVGDKAKVACDDYPSSAPRGVVVVVDRIDKDGDYWCGDFVFYEEDLEPISAPQKRAYTGGSVNYYRVKVESPTSPDVAPYEAECNDIIEALGMNYAEGNAFKAIWRSCAARQGQAKRGYDDGLYDAEKVVFFGQRMVAQAKGEK